MQTEIKDFVDQQVDEEAIQTARGINALQACSSVLNKPWSINFKNSLWRTSTKSCTISIAGLSVTEQAEDSKCLIRALKKIVKELIFTFTVFEEFRKEYKDEEDNQGPKYFELSNGQWETKFLPQKEDHDGRTYN
jgi:hypothetical protein